MMKNIFYLAIIFLFFCGAVNAKTVSLYKAQTVAENYISGNVKIRSMNLSLAYIEKSTSGEIDYYVFNINNSGFIIVSAEDAGYPIIGYSTEKTFEKPSATINPNFNFWLEKRKTEIEFMRNNNISSDATIQNEWTEYASERILPTVNTATFLCQTTWGSCTVNNSCCSSGCSTASVEVAMAQIMKKWNYPSHGIGSYSYNCDTVNFAAETYNWANMSLTGCDSNIVLLMYDCGISVGENYGDTPNGGFICGGNPSAQYSFVNYFGYRNTIQCLNQTSYPPPQWLALLDAEFNAGRPVLYQGIDPTNGGHAWVADGADSSGNIHMNWGWNGSADGFYAVTNLNPTNLNFTQSQGGLFGIEPSSTNDVPIINSIDGISVFPNPTNGLINISAPINTTEIFLTNSIGQKIFTLSKNKTKFDISSFLSGIYFLNVKTPNGVAVKKIIKQ